MEACRRKADIGRIIRVIGWEVDRDLEREAFVYLRTGKRRVRFFVPLRRPVVPTYCACRSLNPTYPRLSAERDQDAAMIRHAQHVRKYCHRIGGMPTKPMRKVSA